MAEAAWICGFCDHILDASVLGDVYESAEDSSDRVPSVREERTSLIVWNPRPDSGEDDVPDAMILGDAGVAEDDFQLMRGAARRDDGRTATFLFYASNATSRIIHPDAVPRITGGDQTIPRTPYEDFILSQIDGVRSVREIHRASGLAPQEVMVTLLTLLDKGGIRIDGVSSPQHGMRDLDGELETTQAIERAASTGPIPVINDEDLPSATDFAELIAEVNQQISKRAPSPRLDSFSDVWAEPDPDSAVNADALIEDQEEIPTQLGEEVTNTGRPTSRRASIRNERSDTKPPIPRATSPAERALPADELPTREDPPERTLSPVVRPSAISKTPVPAPLLDPAFLVEVPPSERLLTPGLVGDLDEEPVVAPVGETRRESTGKRQKARDRQRRALAKAVKRGPIQEVRRGESQPRPKRKAHSERLEPVPVPEDASNLGEPTPLPHGRPKAEPIDSLNMLKAQKLFDQALKDKSEGNLVSARMNMKLAMTFDPTNELYAESFDDLSKNPDAQVRANGPTGKSRARDLYDQATEAENSGDVDRAITLLEQAIACSKQAPFLNRLGVLLAMKKREFSRAQQLVEQAKDLAPDNTAYEKNLQKILSMAATSDMRRNDEERDNKKGLLGLLGRRK